MFFSISSREKYEKIFVIRQLAVHLKALAFPQFHPYVDYILFFQNPIMVDQRLGNIFFKTQQYGMSQNFVGIVIWKSQFKTIYFQKFRRRNIFFCFPEENIRGIDSGYRKPASTFF